MSEPRSGPRWRRIEVGARVVRLGRPSGVRGTVVGIESRGVNGVTTFVAVRWDRAVKFSEIWGADFLVVVDEADAGTG